MGSCVSNTDNSDSYAKNPKEASPNSKQNNRENHGKSAKKYAPAAPQDIGDQVHGKKKDNKPNDQLSSDIQRLTDEKNVMENNHKIELQNKTAEIEQLQERLKQFQHDYCKKEKEREERYKMTVDSLMNELERTKEEKNDLLTRLIALAANRLTDGNANIADLCDENGPTKLSEKYSELFDNQWTDAFTYLSSYTYRGEEELCSILVHAFCVIYLTCRKKADADLRAFICAIDDLYESYDLARDMIKTANNRRKRRPRMKVEEIKQLYNSDMQQIIPAAEQKGIESFLDESIELCWLMAIQDPPVYVDTNLLLRDKPFETNFYKPYTAQGQYVDFIVWPALYLHEGGSLLNKGIAQGKKQKHETQSKLNEIFVVK